MVQLFLSEPGLGDDGNGDVANERISLLNRLESIIWSIIASGGRSEARLWLCTTISCISSITPHDQCELFVELLRFKLPKRAIASQLLQMIFEKRPQKVGSIIAKKSYMLEKFFEGNPRRIMQWFGNFASVGESEHRKGARAISQFAFVNRDICWDELEWKGKHGQSPAVVATKPHYFLDLDVLSTVENFLENVPNFWSSDELAESLKDGEILLIDTKFFVDQFVRLMYEENLEDIWAVIKAFLIEEKFSFLCQHLLILLDERELLAFLKSLRRFLIARPKSRDFGGSSYWLENLLLTCNDCASIDELLLLNAVINQGRQLICLVRDEEHEEEKGTIEKLLEISTWSSNSDQWALMNGCVKMNKSPAIKLIGLQSWLLHYRLSKECKTPESWESLFIQNRITFRRSESYSLVMLDRVPKRSGSDLDDGGSIRAGRKKKAKNNRKTKKRGYGCDDNSEDELVELETSTGWQDLQLGCGSWLLPTDGYSCPWNSVDLPEHLARHCFSTWIKWVFSK
ncbi:uncharacterized protein LOC143858370 [Tasmannia lanceolata]|uniref:uncharacterized protein LOC143858370 n=1 Tax=Tasmannia lanceolata TaxID=3420 RepID=UPI004063DBE5